MLAAAAPFVVLPLLSYLLLDRIAQSAASQLSSAAAEIDEALPEPRPPQPLPLLPEAQDIAELDGEPEAAAASAVPVDGHAAPAASAQPAHGLMVPRARVQAAARAGHRPSGSGVAATAWRGAGMALQGVGGVGVGLRDGDVVTRVGGTPATSLGAVTSAVRAALRKRQPAITAEVWRGRQRIIVTVELPLEDDDG